ncbi:MAG: HipA family kinase, partial [Bryobacteraceae bacterium]
ATRGRGTNSRLLHLMPVEARRHVRKMRGGAQSHMVEASDGAHYIVKFVNNPQHRRILINEMVAAEFLRYLQITSPATAIVNLSEEFLAENPEVRIELGGNTVGVPAGRHFGSRFPGDPSLLAVYDYLPDVLLYQVANSREFLGVLAFDKWMGNSDARQSVFFRARLRDWVANPALCPDTGIHPRKLGFVALMIDHGFVFNGPGWEFVDGPLFGTYPRKLVYEKVRSVEDFEPWLSQIVHFPEHVVDQALKQVPPEWMNGDGEPLETLLETLLRRRKRLPDILSDCRRAKQNPFPLWT